ncbi:MAG: hypothetical protein ACXWCG_07510 [Flavitalea sp.]
METKLKVSQFVKESDEWKRTLTFLSQENSFLKLRLSDILNGKESSADFVEAAELYQSHFIQKDEIIKLLLQDVSRIDDLLTREIYGDGMLIKEVVFKQNHLRKQVRFVETEFNKLKLQFNNYLSEL